ncbi:hypothetical protein L226DRAFT_465506 [Lentinus tigrinus ALCF2SS1-7]|uniref:ZZ-type domain-containing protein n=1 Tax=Lentinus tigrinus ALCF2SS1-6 TaxID=1328759 RepID=A0A5C2S709_9APHY|nr:hypothetical protein L227DRAFT_528293 [Lentinus tigrinus ALCF2SS1-6]RPD73227.1 hypothetical protein L226DRAFT_465506 [Lentinus tigrinus ALCF2SS1-7]
MSVVGSDYGGSSYGRSEPRPDKALIVKCTHEERGSKKISYQSSRLCTYDNLRKQVERCFGLNSTPFYIAYVDDDSETTLITNEADLTEAINYFKPTTSDDVPLSSAASILSGRSFRKSQIVLRVHVVVDYDGISLSDTGSLVSLEEYRNRNGSGQSLSYSSEPPRELEDDAITVSSKDIGSKYDAYRGGKGTKTIVAGPSREPLIDPHDQWETRTLSSAPRTRQSGPLSSDDTLARYPEDPSSVFARLKLEEERLGLSPGNLNGASTFQTERGVHWLREQNSHLSILDGDGVSISDVSLEDSMSLELERNQHGNYRYTLTGSSGSAASQSVRDFGYDDGASVGVNDAIESLADSAEKFLDSRPTSMQATQFSHPHRSSNPFMGPEEQQYPTDYIHPDIPPEVLSFLRPDPPLGPPPDPTNCSNCGVVLDMIKYVCSTCGEKKPIIIEPQWTGDVKGKTRAIDIQREHSYPPLRNPPSAAASASSLTMVGSQHSGSGSSGSSEHHPSRSMSESTLHLKVHRPPYKPLPIPPSQISPVSSSSPGSENRRRDGYELCSNCVQAYGVQHSLEFSATPGTSPGPGTSPEDAERALSRWRRTAPSQKGVLRHAYIEKSWTHNGWEDVEQGGTGTCHCSTCNTIITNHRYKCASCDDFNLCRACYRQVYEVHPAHAFLAVPDKPSSSMSSTSTMVDLAQQSSMDESSMTHIGVHCAHCMQEIVGARFHCAICENVDICSNCDAAGLPGNIDSADGGHVSSHIMIKIPHPMSTADLHSTSQMAMKLWTGRDAAQAQAGSTNGRPRRNSYGSAYSHTVLGTGARVDPASVQSDHGMVCDGCAQPIVGVRYQCANCPSYPKPISLCERCEARSYALHDPWHVFFKLPKPVDRPLVLQPPLPPLYKRPAGPAGGVFNLADPKGYLRSLTHAFAVCDRCMSHISGEWFHCAYCPKDLCDSCAEVDTHDNTHLFVVFKSDVNMQIFRYVLARFMNEEDPSRSPPLIPFPVYNS